MNLYVWSVPVFARGLSNLATLLAKSSAHAQQSRYDVGALLGARLFPDMFPLIRQVQLATDFAKGSCARLAGLEVPRWEDTETTLDEITARITRAQDFLASLRPEQFEQAATRRIELKTPAGDFSFAGDAFLQQWGLPNFYFHATTVYNLLRHNGVPIGKLDFLGPL
jgi:hypothetical protein